MNGNGDTLARARARLDAMGSVAETARTFGAVFTVEGSAALALLALAEAVGRLAEVSDFTFDGDGSTGCIGCGGYYSRKQDDFLHDDPCPVPQIMAALAQLAALAPEVPS